MGKKIKLKKDSKISYVEVFNFMAFEHAKAYFDETGILNIKGYNSTGKSAFETAVAVCLMDAYKGKQGKFIRHDCDYFRVVVGFEDGVSIVKDKYISGQSLYEMYKDDELIFTTKQGNKLAKVAEIPTIIKKYLDLIETDIGYLNYQTCRDPLWLMETKGSENYSSLNEILKSEEISRANAMLNSDINQLNSDIAILESEIQRKELQLQASQGVTSELISAVEEKEYSNRRLDDRYSHINEILEYEENISEINPGYNVGVVGINRLKDIEEIMSVLSEREDIKIHVEVPEISSKRFEAVLEVSNTLDNLEKIGDPGTEVESMNYQRQIEALNGIVQEMKDLLAVSQDIQELKNQSESLTEEKATFVEEAKKEGRYFIECENCGTLMEVNTSGI